MTIIGLFKKFFRIFHRDTITGRFVSKKYVKEHPDHTITEKREYVKEIKE